MGYLGHEGNLGKLEPNNLNHGQRQIKINLKSSASHFASDKALLKCRSSEGQVISVLGYFGH